MYTKILLLLIVHASVVPSEKVFKIDHFEGICSGKKHLPMYYKEFKLTQNDKGETLTSLTLEAKEHISGPIKSQLLVERCSRRDPDKCTTFRKSTDKNYCDTIESPTSPFAMMYQAVKPRWKCPIRKGTYRITNKVTDTKLVSMMLSDSYLWKFRTELFDIRSGKLLMCASGRTHLE